MIAIERENDAQHGIITELQGQAFGPEPGSFRAEAYGMLAGLRLILQACKPWQIELQAEVKLFCDNEGLIKRMNKRAERVITLLKYNLPDGRGREERYFRTIDGYLVDDKGVLKYYGMSLR